MLTSPTSSLSAFGDFCRFCGRTMAWVPHSLGRRRDIRRLMQQTFEVGTRSVPVVMITGALNFPLDSINSLFES